MVIDLKRKLLKIERITRMCGQSKAVHGNDPLVFRRKLERYMDSSSEVGGGSFWSVKSTTSPANVRLGVDSDGMPSLESVARPISTLYTDHCGMLQFGDGVSQYLGQSSRK